MSFVTIEGVRVNTAAVVSVEQDTTFKYDMEVQTWIDKQQTRAHFEQVVGQLEYSGADVREYQEQAKTVRELPYPSRADYLVTVVRLSDGRKIEVPDKSVEEVEAMLEPPVQVWPSSPPLPLPLPTEFYTW